MPPEDQEILDTSPRADLEAAFEKHEKLASEQNGGSPEDTEEPIRPSEQKAEGAPEAGADTDAAAGKEPQAGKKSEAGGKPSDEVKPGDKSEKPEAPDPNAAQEIKPPVGWKAAAKQEWAKIPKAAQEEIARRETETSRALSQSVNARKLFDEFNQTVAPFMPLIRAQNSTPLAAMKNLMTTAAGLTVGSPEQKARIVAEMIGNFNIDIATLDQILAGNPPQGGGAPGTSQIEVAIQRQLAPVFDFMNGVKQTQAQREAQLAAEAETEVVRFMETHDFAVDLQDEIADLMEVSARRGRKMSIGQAYEIAVQQNSEIKAIIDQRKSAAEAAARAGAVDKARRAARSVSGRPNNAPTHERPPESRREEIAAAWDEHSNQ